MTSHNLMVNYSDDEIMQIEDPNPPIYQEILNEQYLLIFIKVIP